jgi:hypothetical protein
MRLWNIVVAATLFLAVLSGATLVGFKYGEPKQVVGWLLGLVSLLVGAVVGPVLNYCVKRHHRPVLTGGVEGDKGSLVETVKFTPDEEKRASQIEEALAIEPVTPSLRIKHARLRVVNAGRRDSAVRCRGTLTKIERYNGTTWDELPYHDAGQLIWAYVGTPERELPRNVPAYLDLCFVMNLNQTLILCLNPLPEMYKKIINGEGSYRLHVLLTADNADPVTKVVRMNWSGKYDQLSVEMVE